MIINFLGTNGWYSTYDSLTPCVLIDSDEAYIVLDAGEGIQKLDEYITDETKPIYIFISHFHLDHIHGFHIFPKFNFKQDVTVFGKTGLKKMAEIFLNHPFTKKYSDYTFDIKFIEVDEGKHQVPFNFSCALLPHPDPSMGFRFEIDGKILTYCTDTGEHPNLEILAKNSDLLITECAHRPGEVDESWPHLNPETAARIAKNACAKKLALMHFDASRYTKREDRTEAQMIAARIFRNTVSSFDDYTIEL